MAPTKNTRAVSKQAATTTVNTLIPLARKGLTRRATNVQDQNMDVIQTRGKRKAEDSPTRNEKVKRSALGNLTNNVKPMTMTTTGQLHPENEAKQQQQQQTQFTKKKDSHLFGTQTQVFKDTQNILVTSDSGNIVTRQQAQKKIVTRAATKNSNNAKLFEEPSTKLAPVVEAIAALVPSVKTRRSEPAALSKPQPAMLAPPVASAVPTLKTQPNKPVRRISNEFNKTEESLYMSALEDVSSCESMRLSGNFEAAKRRSALLQQEKIKCRLSSLFVSVDKEEWDAQQALARAPPDGVEDFDKANWNDPFQVSHYAMDIFNYLKGREVEFTIEDYMKKQVHLTVWMRTLLVDWMVEVQETFELNHETLYLAVKIVDLFLCRVVITKDVLQLLGAAALFIACKFDERTPPLIEDFLYICDGAYEHDELVRMEMTTLRTINYDLGIPLSYRFLRRYARCGKISMPTLTLARYILELSLMDYATIRYSDSKLACAALYMALRMNGEKLGWTPTLEYYSGYKLVDFVEIVSVLNIGLHRKPKGNVKTIRSKYSHKIFHSVAKVPLMTTDQLCEGNLDISIKVDNS